MSTQDLYGFSTTKLDPLREQIEKALGLQMELHESSYRGGDYYQQKLPGDGSLILQRNYDPIEKEWAEPEYQQAGALLHVYSPNGGDVLKTALMQGVREIRHLQRTCWDPAEMRFRKEICATEQNGVDPRKESDQWSEAV